MNNEQFRRLIASDPPKQRNGTAASPNEGTKATPISLGSRAKSSIPMTPRTVKGSSGIDFARQLAERNATSQTKPKFRSAAPKGSQLAAGYRDRTKDRIEDEDELSRRIRALEEQVKLGQMDQETFEKLRDEITGGDVSATHLVKGLDRKLLERVRRGENVMEDASKAVEARQGPEVDVDDELEKLEQKEVTAVTREKAVKKGEMAPPPVSGIKRSRHAILAELKASRQAATASVVAAGPQLGIKFRKIGVDPEAPRIEIDDKGREVLLTKGPDGKIKRKVRKAQPSGNYQLLPVDKNAKPLGIPESELPPRAPSPPSDEDGDIFEDVGADYDPLADLGEESDNSDNEEGIIHEQKAQRTANTAKSPSEANEQPSDSKPKEAGGRRNYFNDVSASENVLEAPTNPLKDPAILAALQSASRKAEARGEEDGSSKDPDEQERLKRRAAMLATDDRDMEDMDMGFGSSRFADAEDLDESTRIKLSKWKGVGAEDDDGGGQGGPSQKKRKRGPKKRKGDKNNVADVMGVMEKTRGS